MGTKANFHQVFGLSPVKWFIPIPTYLGNGLAWPAKIPKSVDEKKQAHEAESDRAQLLAPQSIMSRRLEEGDDLDLESADY